MSRGIAFFSSEFGQKVSRLRQLTTAHDYSWQRPHTDVPRAALIRNRRTLALI